MSRMKLDSMFSGSRCMGESFQEPGAGSQEKPVSGCRGFGVPGKVLERRAWNLELQVKPRVIARSIEIVESDAAISYTEIASHRCQLAMT
jgi:hypothetical protein